MQVTDRQDKHFKVTKRYILPPVGPLQAVIQDTPQMAAKLADTTLLCLKVQDGFCQELILHIVPSDCCYFLTCQQLDSIPAQAMEEKINEWKQKVLSSRQTNKCYVSFIRYSSYSLQLPRIYMENTNISTFKQQIRSSLSSDDNARFSRTTVMKYIIFCKKHNSADQEDIVSV